MELSVVIPARNEMFLGETVADVLAHSGDETEVLVILDGCWPEVPLEAHPRVSVIHLEESIGQRAATNLGARLARGRYLMKLDAHCAVDAGFDAKLLRRAATLPEDVLLVPRQFNLHVFDWVCDQGHRRYQGRSGPCKECGGETKREIVWKPRRSRLTTAWRFDRDLHFQYWRELTKRQEGDLTETMSLLGACWFLARDYYWRLEGLDEKHGSWGQMGTELACKVWLSGGRVLVDHRTWFAHMFRTAGGDFGFPYPLKQRDTDAARRHSWDLWRRDDPDQMPRWSGAKRPLRWLLEHFAPVPGWEEVVPGERDSAEDNAEPALTKGIAYYTDCRGDRAILEAVRARLQASTNGHQIATAALDVIPFGDVRIVFANLERGYLTMFRQILAALQALDSDVAFLCEHDVLYPPEHFAFTPPKRDVVYYNEHVWKVDSETGRALHYRVRQTSGLCAYRDTLLEHYERRIALVRKRGFSRNMGFEPGTHGRPERVDDLTSEAFWTDRPLVDIRHGENLTPSRWKREQFRNQRYTKGWTEADEVPGWGKTLGRFNEFLQEATEG